MQNICDYPLRSKILCSYGGVAIPVALHPLLVSLELVGGI